MAKDNKMPRLDSALVGDIRRMIEKSRQHVAAAVNAGLTSLYWVIERRIHQEILEGDRADYGKGILATLSQQLRQSNFRELLPLEKPLQRDFYAEMCRVERWSVRTLRRKIDSMLYERTAISKKPEEVIRHEIDSLPAEDRLTPDLVFKDPQFLDFLGLQDPYLEKDLEDAILRKLERFLLEMGTGFSFIARQMRIQVDNDDYYIDLLFSIANSSVFWPSS